MKKRIAAITLCIGLLGCSDSVSVPQNIPLEEVVDVVNSPKVVELPDTRDYPQSSQEPTVYVLGYKAMRINPVTSFMKELEETLFYKKLKP